MCSQDCGRAFGMFGEVAQLDLTRLRNAGRARTVAVMSHVRCSWASKPSNAGSVRVRFFEVGAAHALREYLRHGSLWRCFHEKLSFVSVLPLFSSPLQGDLLACVRGVGHLSFLCEARRVKLTSFKLQPSKPRLTQAKARASDFRLQA